VWRVEQFGEDDLATSIDEYAAILRNQIVDLRDEMRARFG